MNKYLVMPIVLNQFAGYINTIDTTTVDTPGANNLRNELKTYYSDYLIDLVEAELIHDQFEMKHPIHKNGGKTIEFRGFNPLPALPGELTLKEGVTPDGQKMEMFIKPAKVEQYGGYVLLSDMLLLTAIDNNIVQATQLIASQAGRTLDTITRNKLASECLIMNDDTPFEVLTVKDIRKAVAALKKNNAPTINGYYVGIIHPDVAFDIMSDDAWVAVKNYDSEDWYNGEIGRIAGVRFIETPTAYTEGNSYTTTILGANAYAVTEISGGGLQHIVKQLGYGDDPLNQRASVGWKATRAVEVLVPQYTMAIESKSKINE